MPEAYIVDAIRTPVGKRNGGLSGVHTADLGAHILNALFAALQQRGSAYAAVPGALLELAGEKAQALQIAAEEPIDVAWQEPPVFDGCSSKGQARPDQPQPIRIVRQDRPLQGERA